MKEAPKKDKQELIHLSYNMSGKMENILSLSTNNNYNERCACFKNVSGSICEKGFAEKTVEHYPGLNANTKANLEILRSRLLTDAELQALAIEIVAALDKNGTRQFRLESFGDIANVTHARNYIRLCSAIARIDCSVLVAWWTKSPNYVVSAFNLEDEETRFWFKSVCNLILSSLFIGVPFPEKARKKIESALGMEVLVFTVEAVKPDDKRVNCGARSCLNCKRWPNA